LDHEGKRQRLKVLHRGDDFLFIEKPKGVLTDYTPGDPKTARLTDSLRKILTPKEHLQGRANIEHQTNQSFWQKSQHVRAVYPLELEVSGAVLITTSPFATQTYRNALGSGAFTFTFTFFAQKDAALEKKQMIDLPLYRADEEPQVRVSHKLGKKSLTIFEPVDSHTRVYTQWLAQTHYPRFHQIRIHAAEMGLKMIGVSLYAQGPIPYLKDFKQKSLKGKTAQEPLFEGLALHLIGIEGAFGEAKQPIGIPIPLPKYYHGLIHHMQVEERPHSSRNLMQKA